MAEETRAQIKARLDTGDTIDQDATHNLCDSVYFKSNEAPAAETGTEIDLSNIFGNWYGTPSSPVTDTAFTLGTIVRGGWAAVYQDGASATFTGVTDDQSQHNTTVNNLYILFSPDGTDVSMVNAYASPPDRVPIAFNLSLSGTEESGNTLTLSYTYADEEGDTEGSSIFKWYSADDTNGTNEAVIAGATSSSYELTASEEGKYVRASVTPVAQTGGSPGAETFSDYTGAIAVGSGFYPTDIQVSASGLFFLNMTDEATSTITLDSSTYSPEDAIASMVDEFASVTFDRSVATQRPRYKASAGTGTHNAFWYNASINQELITASPTSLNFSNGDSFTVVLGVLFEDQLREDVPLFKGSASTDERYMISKHSDESLRIWIENTLCVNEAGVFTGRAGENMVIVHTFDGTDHEVYINGADQNVTTLLNTPITNDTNRWWVGAKVSLSMKGEIAFCAVFRSVLSAGDRNDIETWAIDLLDIP